MTNNRADSQSSSGFVPGFVAGVAASAVGYFFFGTERGKRLKSVLSDKWQEAQTNTSEGVAPNDTSEPTTLREAVRAIVDQVMTAVEQTEVTTQKKVPKKTPKKRKKKKMFQGVK